MYVMFDTNYFVSDFKLDSYEFNELKKNVDKLGIAIMNCPFVIDEATQKYREFLIEYNRKSKHYQNLIPDYCKRLADDEIERLVEKYRDYISNDAWKDIRMNVKTAIPNFKNLHFMDLFKRDMLKKKPFGNKGKGLRDMVIWESLKEAIRAYLYEDQVFAFISNNDNDFCDKTDNTHVWKPLHKDLYEELLEFKEIALKPDSIRVYPSLKAFNHDMLREKSELFDRLIDELNESRQNELKKYIENNLIKLGISFNKPSYSLALELEGLYSAIATSIYKNWTDSFEDLNVLLICKCIFRDKEDTKNSVKLLESEMMISLTGDTKEFKWIDLGSFG